MAVVQEVRELLSATTVPPPLVDRLLETAPELWIAAHPAKILAADLTLSYPLPGPDETRVMVSRQRRNGATSWQLTVLAQDRRGLLATTAGVLAAHELSITSATAAAWSDPPLALQRLRISDPAARELTKDDWAGVRSALEAAMQAPERTDASQPPAPTGGEVTVGIEQLDGARTLVTIATDDRVGLLWLIGDWLDRHGNNIEFAKIASRAGHANDVLIVDGAVDDIALAAYLKDGSDASVVTVHEPSRGGIVEAIGALGSRVLEGIVDAGAKVIAKVR